MKTETMKKLYADDDKAETGALQAVHESYSQLGEIYASLNLAEPVSIQGWAIPAATDIAFALGVFSLFGSRLPISLKVFLLSVAIFDDLAAKTAEAEQSGGADSPFAEITDDDIDNLFS